MTDDEIRAIQRIGRDFAGRMSTVGLVELDALCEEAIARGRVIAKIMSGLGPRGALAIEAEFSDDEIALMFRLAGYDPKWAERTAEDRRRLDVELAAALERHKDRG